MYGRNVIEGYSFGMNAWLHFGLNIFVLVGFIILITMLVRQLMKYMETNKPNKPLEELKMRLARGEITEKEYNAIKEIL